MKNIGIVCEFNPFHCGHEYLIRECGRMAGEDCRIICAMSGDFVQRGEPAIFSKYARAEAAVRSGADLVAELPLPWSIASAEKFAEGAVSLLNNMGATHIAFGTECGELSGLERLADILSEEKTLEAVRDELNRYPELSFAEAREKVLFELAGGDAELIKTPNNILAVEYLKAIRKLGLDIIPMTVKRSGSGHDRAGEEGFKSSSELRKMLLGGESVDAYIPQSAAGVYKREIAAGRGPVSMAALETAILSRLRMLKEADFETLPDSAGGAGRRLYRAVREEATTDAVLTAAKTKRFALARLRRMLLAAALGVTGEMTDTLPAYARILSANSRGLELLHENRDKEGFLCLTKPSSVRKSTGDNVNLFAVGAYAHDLYVLAYPAESERKGDADWKTGPVIV